MATGGPKYNRSVKKQKRAIDKRSSDEDQTADVTCRCRAGKKTLCQSCKKSPKKLKLSTGKTDDLTDDPEVVMGTSIVTEESLSRSGSRYWDVNFSEYFTKNFKQVLKIQPGNRCFKIKYLKENIWAPIISEKVVNVYNTIGNVQKTIGIKLPRSVELDDNDNGDIFIACYHSSGLYVMDDNETPQKICCGSFVDVYAYRDKVYALEYKRERIMEFCCRPDVDNVRLRWRSDTQSKIDDTGEYDLIVTGDEDLMFYVSHWDHHKISQYNKEGQCIKRFVLIKWDRHKISQYNKEGQCIKRFGSRFEAGDGKLYYPRLCGIDRQSHLLVIDWNSNVYKILDPGTGQWKSSGLREETGVYDATLDDEGNMWLSQHNGNDHIITKHKPQ